MFRFVIGIAASALVLAGHAAAYECTPKFRVGNVLQIARTNCVYTYGVDAICNPSGECPEGERCANTGSYTYEWTVVQTGGSGSIVVDRLDWTRINVTVTPPVKFELKCKVGGCSTCCTLEGGSTECTSLPVTVPEATSSTKSVRISRCD